MRIHSMVFTLKNQNFDVELWYFEIHPIYYEISIKFYIITLVNFVIMTIQKTWNCILIKKLTFKYL